jgi:DNA-binding SARP family transcriptional activator
MPLAQQRYHDVIAESGELTIHHPLRERFWAQRMLALYLSGRQAQTSGSWVKIVVEVGQVVLIL